MQEMSLVKNGERVVSIDIARTKKRLADVGFLVTVKVHPTIEEFFREMMQGQEPSPITTWGRQWVQVGDTPLLAYHLHSDLSGPRGGNTLFRLDYVGKSALTFKDPSTHENCTNLGFLRMVGISEGAGVTFGVRGVYERDTLRAMQDSVLRASARFYEQYLKPINLSIHVSTQEYVPMLVPDAGSIL
jgi:hypothetical protein